MEAEDAARAAVGAAAGAEAAPPETAPPETAAAAPRRLLALLGDKLCTW